MNAFRPEHRPAYLSVSARKSWEQKAGDLKCSALVAAIRSQEAVVSGWEQIDRISRAKDPRLTTTAHLEKINKLSSQLVNKSHKDLLRVIDLLKVRRNDLKKEIADNLKIQETSTSAELRSIIRSLPIGERKALINKAISEGDSEVLSACLLGHPVAVGLEKSHIENYRSLAEEKLSPELFQYEKHLQAVQSTFFDVIDQNFELLTKSDLSKQEKDAISMAEQTTKAFNESMQKKPEEVEEL